jgi:hypothetical protein
MNARILVPFLLFTAACVSDDEVPVHMQDPEAEVFRAGLASEDDLALEFNADTTRQQALAGQVSVLAALTADAVLSTNHWVFAHIHLMRAISLYPPTLREENARTWEGTDKGNFYRVKIEREVTPDGVFFTYSFEGRLESEPETALRVLLEGEVLRTTTGPRPDGEGVVRFFFDNLSHLDPNSDTTGTARVAFRKTDGQRQVHNRMINMVVPDDEKFPEFAEYTYTQFAGGGGEMKWFSKGDIKEDGAPYEYISAHSAWQPNLSGVGSAVAFGGSIDVEQWNLTECWGSTLHKTYDRFSIPTTAIEDGDSTTCVMPVAELEIPEYQETLPDEDPTLPAN